MKVLRQLQASGPGAGRPRGPARGRQRRFSLSLSQAVGAGSASTDTGNCSQSRTQALTKAGNCSFMARSLLGAVAEAAFTIGLGPEPPRPRRPVGRALFTSQHNDLTFRATNICCISIWPGCRSHMPGWRVLKRGTGAR